MVGRVILLEPSLTSSTGHFAITADRLTACLAPTPVVVVPGADAAAEIATGRKSLPRFKHSRTAIARIRHYGPTLECLIRHTESHLPNFLRKRGNRMGRGGPDAGTFCARADAASLKPLVTDDLLGILRSIGTDAQDLLFFPSTDAELILAAAELHRLEPSGPPIALRLMYDDFGSHSTAPTWRSALRLLLGLPKARFRFHLFAETLQFAAAIGDSSRQDVLLFPHPTAIPASPPPVLNGEFVFLVPGTMRADKGEHLLKQISAHLAALLQTKALPFITVRTQSCEAFACDKFRFELLPSFLSDQDYARQWQNCHAALLLHDPTIFGLRGSGTACDAVAGHRPFLALRGSSCGQWIRKNNGILAEPDARSVAHRMVDLIENYRDHSAGCAAAASHLDTCLAQAVQALRRCLPISTD